MAMIVEPRRSRRSRIVVLVVAAVIILAVGSHLWLTRAHNELRDRMKVLARAPSAAPAAHGGPEGRSPTAASSFLLAPRPRQAPISRTACGFAPTSLAGNLATLYRQQVASSMTAAHQGALALLDSPFAHDRAAGAILTSQLLQGEVNVQAVAARSECGSDHDCMRRQSAIVSSRVAEIIRDEQAVLAAAALADPADLQLYGLAVQRCASIDDAASACLQLSADEWARRDVGNLAAWLSVMSNAHRRGDWAAADSALARASSATFLRRPTQLVASAQAAGLPPDLPVLSRLLLQAASTTLLGSSSDETQAQRAICSKERVSDVNLAQDCERFTSNLVERASTLTDFHEAAVLGGALGWPEARLADLRRRRAAATDGVDPVLGGGGDPRQILSCDAAEARAGYLADMGEVGEIGALQRARQQRRPP